MGHAATQEVEPIEEEADTPLDSDEEWDTHTPPPHDSDDDRFDAGEEWAARARPASLKETMKMVWRTPFWASRAGAAPKPPPHAASVTAVVGNVHWAPAADASPDGAAPLAMSQFTRAGSAASSTGGSIFGRTGSDPLAMSHFTRAGSAASSTGGSIFGRTGSDPLAMSHFTRAGSAASSTGGSTFGRTASDTLRWLSSGLAGGLKRRLGFGQGPRPHQADSVVAGAAASSVMTPSNWLQSAVAAECVFVGRGRSRVEVYPAPVKTVKRMREKVLEYAGSAGEGAKWPLCANILDPVRASVVCSGPAEILEVLDWFLGRGERAAAVGERPRLLPVCRIKNKFAFSKDEIVGG
jgi:hypothetical protein